MNAALHYHPTPTQARAASRHSEFHQKIAARAAALVPLPAPVVCPAPELPVPAAPVSPPHYRCKECWFQILDVSVSKTVSIRQIQQMTCDYFGVTLDDMTSARRQIYIIRPRQIAMFFCKELTQATLPAIGRKFGGRDHTTALHGHRKIAALILSGAEPKVSEAVIKIRADLAALL